MYDLECGTNGFGKSRAVDAVGTAARGDDSLVFCAAKLAERADFGGVAVMTSRRSSLEVDRGVAPQGLFDAGVLSLPAPLGVFGFVGDAHDPHHKIRELVEIRRNDIVEELEPDIGIKVTKYILECFGVGVLEIHSNKILFLKDMLPAC
ncbi:hypothetical protein BN1708_010617 [Verticillium longisporum]|uniref:Uncharacterized protein n=1 Tax=Verticillium longisporum TaxID=100787 RepID=A0A0G4KT33_VERLO|nr:hypothetical protein BN1708_010617 [Verticillium longisporum]